MSNNFVQKQTSDNNTWWFPFPIKSGAYLQQRKGKILIKNSRGIMEKCHVSEGSCVWMMGPKIGTTRDVFQIQAGVVSRADALILTRDPCSKARE